MPKRPHAAIDHVVHRWRVFVQPGGDPINPRRGNGSDVPAPIISTDLRRSANTPQAGEVFHKIGGVGNPLCGFGHPGGELAGSGDVVRGEDGAQVRDQRLLGSGQKAPGGVHPFVRSSRPTASQGLSDANDRTHKATGELLDQSLGAAADALRTEKNEERPDLRFPPAP